jgi:hypothetical protein
VSHPLLDAWWLETRGRLARTKAVAVFACVLLGVLASARFWSSILQVASAHLLVAGVLLSLAASVWVHRQRQYWRARFLRGWLATVPVSRREFMCIVAARSIAWPAFVWLSMSIATLCTAALSARQIAVWPLLAIYTVSVVAGSMLGWWLPHHATTRPGPSSKRASLARASTRPKTTALSYWPISQARVWLQPRSIARLLVPAALLLPQNTSGNMAIAALALCVLGLYLSVLLRATVHAAREAADWLRPTPLTLGRFSWSVLNRPTLKQLQWTLLGSMLLLAVGIEAVLVVRIVEVWLAVVSVVSSIAATQAYYSRTVRYQIVSALSAIALIESFKEHLALPCAVLFSAWKLGTTVRSKA